MRMISERTYADSLPNNRIIHLHLGDLTRPDSVWMNRKPLIVPSTYQESDRFMLHLSVTGRCYAKCEGCINSSITIGCDDPRNTIEAFDETNPERDVELIQKLTDRHPHKSITICFYGGEPFLALDEMVRVWELLRASDNSDRYCFLVFTNGELLPITHVNELVLYLLTGKERGHTACGVELAKNYDIVSGNVYPCADLPWEMNIGSMGPDGKIELSEQNLERFTDYKNHLGCFRCGVHPYCGGRCPVQALAGSSERTRQICQLMRLHVGLVKERMAEISEGLKIHNISPQYIYGHSAFLTKYTDVVP